MKTEIVEYKFPVTGDVVRSFTDEHGEIWFVAKDVAEALGYKDTDYAIRAHCKAVKILKINSPGNPRGNPNIAIIPERDMYRLGMKSQLPEAEAFEEWVVGEVLPDIRKHGVYATPATLDEMLEDPEAMFKIMDKYREERSARLQMQAERDVAVQTKAWIGSTREATSMATASAAIRRANQRDHENDVLKIELGIAGSFRAVRSMIKELRSSIFTADVSEQAIGMSLAKITRDKGYQAIDIPDPKYGSVKGWYMDAYEDLGSYGIAGMLTASAQACFKPEEY